MAFVERLKTPTNKPNIICAVNPDGSDRGIITVMSELKDKWDDLTDAQQAKIAFDVAATRLKASLCMKKFILE